MKPKNVVEEPMVVCEPEIVSLDQLDFSRRYSYAGNTAKEMGVKFDLYEKAGVKEYWLVEPVDKTILVYVLRDNRYLGLKPFTEEDQMASPLFPELKFAVKEVFE